jgi:hypothetical protein
MPARIARTSAEAQLFLSLLPCERCTATATDWDLGVLTLLDGGGRSESYAGHCASCGADREALFRLPEPVDAAGRFGGPEPSSLLDAAEWLALAGTVELASGPGRDRLARLEYVRDAYAEALKFVPAGADAVPASAVFSDVGRDRLRTEPESLTRGYLEAQLRGVESLIAELRREGPGAAGPPLPRFDLPEDVERARRWLRGALLGAARSVYPDAAAVVERDDGPVAVNAGREDEPADYVCAVAVAVAPEGRSWDAEDAVTRASRALADEGWQLGEPRAAGPRFEATAERAGFVARVRMSADQGVLRLSGETPLFLLAPSRPPAFLAGPAPADESADEPWVAASEQEEILQLALRRGDMAAFFGLLRRMPLYVPVATDPDDPAAPTAYGTLDVDDGVYLAAYTSVGALEYGLGGGVTHRELTFQQLADAWPDPDWRLAVNAGSPIEIYVSIDDVAEPGFRPANDVERALEEAVGKQDWNLLIAALTGAPVAVWTPGPVGSGGRVALGDPGFRWQLTDVSGKPSIAVYTSLDRAGEAGAADLAEGTLAEIARNWPDRTYQLLLNPGSPIAVVLPAEAVPLVAEQDQA